jgi:hypothetical protein
MHPNIIPTLLATTDQDWGSVNVNAVSSTQLAVTVDLAITST